MYIWLCGSAGYVANTDKILKGGVMCVRVCVDRYMNRLKGCQTSATGGTTVNEECRTRCELEASCLRSAGGPEEECQPSKSLGARTEEPRSDWKHLHFYRALCAHSLGILVQHTRAQTHMNVRFQARAQVWGWMWSGKQGTGPREYFQNVLFKSKSILQTCRLFFFACGAVESPATPERLILAWEFWLSVLKFSCRINTSAVKHHSSGCLLVGYRWRTITSKTIMVITNFTTTSTAPQPLPPPPQHQLCLHHHCHCYHIDAAAFS